MARVKGTNGRGSRDFEKVYEELDTDAQKVHKIPHYPQGMGTRGSLKGSRFPGDPLGFIPRSSQGSWGAPLGAPWGEAFCSLAHRIRGRDIEEEHYDLKEEHYDIAPLVLPSLY